MQQIAVITEQHEDNVWGQWTSSTSTIGALVQRVGESNDAFRKRVEAKVKALEAETYGPQKRRVHFGVSAVYATVFDPEDDDAPVVGKRTCAE